MAKYRAFFQMKWYNLMIFYLFCQNWHCATMQIACLFWHLAAKQCPMFRPTLEHTGPLVLGSQSMTRVRLYHLIKRQSVTRVLGACSTFPTYIVVLVERVINVSTKWSGGLGIVLFKTCILSGWAKRCYCVNLELVLLLPGKLAFYSRTNKFRAQLFIIIYS